MRLQMRKQNRDSAIPARQLSRAARVRLRLRGQSESGDVPGWVMVTLMTAALAAVIFAVARPALVDLFNRAITAVNF